MVTAPVILPRSFTPRMWPSAPALPVWPVVPVSPFAPFGIVKSNTAADDVPEFVTLAFVPGAPVVVVPAAMVAAAPSAPSVPAAPTSPRGIVNLNDAALDVPTLVTLALVPGDPVTVLSTPTVAAVPSAPSAPAGPCGPVSPFNVCAAPVS